MIGEHRAAPSESLRERKQRFVRDAILDAAIALFAEKGFDETTVEDIAAAAGVSRRSFFRYFSSKNDLMAHGVLSFGHALTAVIESCPAHLSLAEVVRETVMRVAGQMAAQPQTRVVMHIAARSRAAREAQLSRTAELQEMVALAFSRRLGILPEKDPTPGILAGLTLAVLSVTFRSWAARGEEEIGASAERVFGMLELLAG